MMQAEKTVSLQALMLLFHLPVFATTGEIQPGQAREERPAAGQHRQSSTGQRKNSWSTTPGPRPTQQQASTGIRAVMPSRAQGPIETAAISDPEGDGAMVEPLSSWRRRQMEATQARRPPTYPRPSGAARPSTSHVLVRALVRLLSGEDAQLSLQVLAKPSIHPPTTTVTPAEHAVALDLA